MQIINHLPKSYSEESKYFSDNDFKQNSENQKIELRYQYDNSFIKSDTDNQLKLNLSSNDFNKDPATGAISISTTANAFVGVEFNASTPVTGHLNVYDIPSATGNKNITVTIPKITTDTANGTEYEFFANNIDMSGVIQTNYNLYIRTYEPIRITGYRNVSLSNGFATIRANAPFALIGLKLIIPTGHPEYAYWIASGNCGV